MTHSVQLRCWQAADADCSMLALSIALEHPAASTDPRVLCAAARACKAWREAVQQCRACHTVVNLDPASPLLQLRSFTQWLAKHAPLVKSITASCGALQQTVHGLPWQQHLAAAQRLLQRALQTPASQPAGAPAAATADHAAAAVATSSQQQRHQAGLRVGSFSSNCLVTPGILAALPSHSLTCLDVELMRSRAPDGAALAAALAMLSSLQQLRLYNLNRHRAVAGSCLLGLAQLQQLTSLTFHGNWSDCQQPLQQLLAQPLPLRQLNIHCWTANVQPVLTLDMAALVSMREMTCWQDLPEGSVLPPHLTQLQLDCLAGSASGLAAVLELQQLQRLTAVVSCEEPQPLARLAQLPALQHLVVRCSPDADPAATAAAWPLLPQLVELEIGSTFDCFSPEQMGALLAGLSGATCLTKLQLAASEVREQQWEDGELVEMHDYHTVSACAALAGLARLQELDLSSSWDAEEPWLKAGDAAALTALTGLTKLILSGHHSAVADVEAAALARSLTQLRHLDLSFNHLDPMTCLVAIAKLTQLTELSLGNAYELCRMTQQGLMTLTTLTRLQKLDVNRGNPQDEFEESEQSYTPEQDMEQFWAAVRGQQRRQPVG